MNQLSSHKLDGELQVILRVRAGVPCFACGAPYACVCVQLRVRVPVRACGSACASGSVRVNLAPCACGRRLIRGWHRLLAMRAGAGLHADGSFATVVAWQ